jgi:hypothetical protein
LRLLGLNPRLVFDAADDDEEREDPPLFRFPMV